MSEPRVALRDIYQSNVHPCTYFPTRAARSVVALPGDAPGMHSALAQAGFRRSGEIAYRPTCPACRACVSTRVVVDAFRPGRRFRRVLNRNADLAHAVEPAVCNTEQYALFERYLAARHADGDMYPTTPAAFRSMVGSSWAESEFLTVRCGRALVATAVTDVLDDGLSAVYTYFDPHHAARSLGVYAILMQIDQCRRRGLPYLYLGFWIADHAKMAYKGDYRPAQVLGADGWTVLADGGG